MYNQAIPTTTITTGIDNKNILEANIRLFNGILKPPFLVGAWTILKIFILSK